MIILIHRNYDFFDIIDDYIKDGEVISNDKVPSEKLINCISFSHVYTKEVNSDIGKDICEQFLKLYTSIPNLKDNNRNYENYKKDWNFVNYWLNDKIRESQLNGTICAKYFSEGLEHHCTYTFNFVDISDFIYHIVEEDFKKMKLLYSLYTNYSKLNSILSNTSPKVQQSLLEPSSDFYDNYKKARNMCFGRNNKFCQKLENFKSKYESSYIKVHEKGEKFSKNFKPLPEDENSNIISTATIGSIVGLIPLFGVLYKVRKLNTKL
ncbi:hypothetical protein PVNG_04730 [Plasmodium vivax North Korean]|uniref:PIR Superfamily Protein n=1 Tax=Plasmodium vivax North Korean TaxID=1035514 RepID=A0A0J9WF32_PLAVI|nr:hypothetical protein PVNG_04730 [Plasmodium vivax North Korean]